MEVTNRGLKRILEKTMGTTRKDWAAKLDDALWAFRTAYRTSNGKERQWQLNELEKWHQQAFDNFLIHKARMKKWHDQRLRGSKEFKVGDKVLLYNSCLCLFPGRKLNSLKCLTQRFSTG
eukprot:XP_015580535.1 uncharacterized protein LOC107262011 [Ricinus communis]